MKKSELKPFPPPIPLKKIFGPSFIILALGLGSGEVILWPYLTANFGLGIAWGALLGITFQFFINMEIERYALIKGESVFVGIDKVFSWAAYWFIISTFIGFGLPGIIAAAAQIFAFILGVENFKWLAVAFLVLIGVILSVGKTVYGLMEKITKTVIFAGIPLIVVLAAMLTSGSDWLELGKGLLGRGRDYNFLPIGISLATFFAAFAYSGAGGNLNLTQSIYIKEKGYGMGQYSQKISGLFKNLKERQKIDLAGKTFELNDENIKNFQAWWKKINLEHLLIFWLLGLLGMAVLMILAFTTAFGLKNNVSGINFVINEGMVIGQELLPLIGTLFLLVVSVMLFQTQLGILDSTSRIMAENLALKKIKGIDRQASSAHFFRSKLSGINPFLAPRLGNKKFLTFCFSRSTSPIKNLNDPKKQINLSKIYFSFLWAQIAFGIVLFLFNIYEPQSLIILGALINAFAMFVHIGLVNWTNHRLLPKVFRPNWRRRLIIIIIFLFFGAFSALTLWDLVLKKIF